MEYVYVDCYDDAYKKERSIYPLVIVIVFRLFYTNGLLFGIVLLSSDIIRFAFVIR